MKAPRDPGFPKIQVMNSGMWHMKWIGGNDINDIVGICGDIYGTSGIIGNG